MTKGEYRVGISFNPSGDDLVARIKAAAAALIDLCEAIPEPLNDIEESEVHWLHIAEVRRCKATAATAIEAAAMWAVKAATKRPMEG